MGKMRLTTGYLSGLDDHQAEQLGEKIYKRFRRMVAAQVAIAEGDDHGDDLARTAVLDMVALATSTAANVYRYPRSRRLAPPPLQDPPPYSYDEAAKRLLPMLPALPARPSMAPPVRGEVSTDGRTWVDYRTLIDPDPFDSYPFKRGRR